MRKETCRAKEGVAGRGASYTSVPLISVTYRGLLKINCVLCSDPRKATDAKRYLPDHGGRLISNLLKLSHGSAR